MAKFCTTCGNPLPEGAKFCASCGAAAPVPAPTPAPVQEPAPAPVQPAPQSVYEQPVYHQPVSPQPEAPKKKKTGLIIAIVAVIAALIVAAVLIPWGDLFGGSSDDDEDSSSGSSAASSPEDAVNLYYDALYEGKSEQIRNLAPKAYWDYVEDEYGIDAKAVKEYYDDEIKEDRIDDLQDEYGKNFKVTFEMEDEDEVRKTDLEKIAEFLKEVYDINKDDIKQVVKMDGELVIKGSEDDDGDDMEDLYVIRIGNEWYYTYVSIGEESAYVSFAVEGLAESAYYDS